MFLHTLLSSILCNISEFIQFCFCGFLLPTNLLRNCHNSFFQPSPNFIYFYTSINFFLLYSCWSSRILYAFLTSGFLRLLTFHLTVFLAFFTLCSLIFIFTTTGL